MSSSLTDRGLSYGVSLPDSIPLVTSHTATLIDLLPTFASYLNHRIALEKEYATKLSSWVGKARSQANVDAPNRGGVESTLEKAFAKMLEEEDLMARERGMMAARIENEVAQVLERVGARLEKGRKKQDAFANTLLSERDHALAARDKARSTYFSSCETLESARVKQANGKESKSDKLERQYTHAVDEMGRTKDRFLLDTELANVANRRLYDRDLPDVHDDFQRLERVAIASLEHSILTLVGIQKASLGRLGQSVENVERAVQAVDFDQDQQSFVLAHSASKLASWELPHELGWEECPVWHDTDAFSITPTSTIYLQNLKIKAEARLAELAPMIEAKRREIEGLSNLADAYAKDPKLGDAGAVLENLFEAKRETTLLSIQQTSLQAETQRIESVLGDEASSIALKLHDFKPSSFVTPAACAVCHSSIWGKGLSCKACSTAVHAKCELKVPAGCGMEGMTRTHSRKSSSSTAGASTLSSRGAGAPSIVIASSDAGGPPRRTVPPPIGESGVTTSQAPPLASTSRANEEVATMLYAYEAQTSVELTVHEADVVSVVEPEDEAGWVKVRTADARIGLVPGSYLQLGGATSAGVGQGDAVEKVTALYSYDAQGADELSFVEGDLLELTELGRDAGEGWAEARKEGRTGLIPLSYVSQQGDGDDR